MLQGLKARTGRENQVYDKGYTRKVAGCVPINKKTGKILLITRRKQEGWVLHPVTNKGLPKAEFRFFEMEVEKLEERWPEMNERDRQWVCYFSTSFLDV
ncbi:10729_t:CDS:2 [Rhizophagus irregularis]|nr:10729_t:CDS:2 [Rhizophagus irregularis]